MYEYRLALVRMRQGDSDREIAASKVMGRPKAAALRAVALAKGWLDAQRALPEDEEIAAAVTAPRRATSTVSSLEPLRKVVEQWAQAGVSGVVMHAALKREHGFTGSYSAVRRMLADIRARQPAQTTVRLHFDPAEAAQVDFGAGPMLLDAEGTGAVRRTWAFVMTLAFSRHQYVEFVWDQTVATWLGCHRRAFEWFGAVPGRLIIDNAKCAIIKACRTEPTVQRAYAECAEGYGFRIDACPPREPQLKGIVEAGVKYVKTNFLALRTIRDLADLNRQVRDWVMTEAGVREHGTTRRRPLDLFGLERPLMRALPAVVPDLGTWHKVGVRFLAHDRQWCLEQAARIGAHCEQLVCRLLTDRILEKLRAAQGVLRLANQFTPARLEAACLRALAHDSPHYRTVKTILAGGHDLRADPTAGIDPDVRHGSNARFARDAADLFPAQPGRLH